MDTLKRLIASALLFGLSLVFVVFVCELLTRFLSPEILDSRVREYHAEFGWTQRAATFGYNVEELDKPVRFEFNRAGYRDVDHQVEKPPRTKRLAILGDSFSEALQVDLQQTYWRQVQDRLNDRSLYRWEVLNFGVGGYGTAQESMTLSRQVMQYEPDALVLQVFPLNDICNNVIDAAYLCGPQDYYRPYLDPGRSYQGITYVDARRAKLRQVSALFSFVEPVLVKWWRELRKKSPLGSAEHIRSHALRVIGQDPIFAALDPSVPPATAVLLNTFTPVQHQLPVIRKGWEATEAAIKMIADQAQEKNIPLIMLVVPSDTQFAPRYPKFKEKLPFPLHKGYADKRLQQLAAQLKLPFVSLLESFDENLDTVLPYIDGHFNAGAHTLTALELEKVVAPLFPDPRFFEQYLALGAHQPEGFELASGFSGPEGGHVWTDGQEAKIMVDLPAVSGDIDYFFSLEAIPFSPAELGETQYVDISINGQQISRWSLPVAETRIQKFQKAVPGTLLQSKDGRIELVLSFSLRKSPKELGINADPRLLGLALTRLSIVSKL